MKKSNCEDLFQYQYDFEGAYLRAGDKNTAINTVSDNRIAQYDRLSKKISAKGMMNNGDLFQKVGINFEDLKSIMDYNIYVFLRSSTFQENSLDELKVLIRFLNQRLSFVKIIAMRKSKGFVDTYLELPDSDIREYYLDNLAADKQTPEFLMITKEESEKILVTYHKKKAIVKEAADIVFKNKKIALAKYGLKSKDIKFIGEKLLEDILFKNKHEDLTINKVTFSYVRSYLLKKIKGIERSKTPQKVIESLLELD